MGSNACRSRVARPAGNLLYFDSSPLSVMIDQEMASLRDGATLPHAGDACGARRAARTAEETRDSLCPEPGRHRAPRGAQARCAWRSKPSRAFPTSSTSCARERRISSAAHRETRHHLALCAPALSPSSLPAATPARYRFRCGSIRRDSANLAGQGPKRLGLSHARADRQSESRDPGLADRRSRQRDSTLDRVGGTLVQEAHGRPCRDRRGVPRTRASLCQDGDRSTIAICPSRGADLASRCFAALYLPPSEKYPTMPIKTLLLPAREFRTDCDVTLLSSERNLQDASERADPDNSSNTFGRHF